MKRLLTRIGLKICLSAAYVLALSTIDAGQAANVPNHQHIVPGVRIGRVSLGDLQKTVRRRLGAPFKSAALPGGLRSDTWRAPKPNSKGTFHTLEAVYRRDAVVQIEATNPAYRTDIGLFRDLDVGDWVRAYGSQRAAQTSHAKSGSKPKLPAIYNLEEASYLYAKRSPATLKYFDWTQRGLALETEKEDDYQAIRSVIVHRPGFRVLPDAGGKYTAQVPTVTSSSEAE